MLGNQYDTWCVTTYSDFPRGDMILIAEKCSVRDNRSPQVQWAGPIPVIVELAEWGIRPGSHEQKVALSVVDPAPTWRCPMMPTGCLKMTKRWYHRHAGLFSYAKQTLYTLQSTSTGEREDGSLRRCPFLTVSTCEYDQWSAISNYPSLVCIIHQDWSGYQDTEIWLTANDFLVHCTDC